MKRLLVFGLVLVLLAACKNQPPYTDNGNPGQIKAIVFYDGNKNGTMDSNETGTQVKVGISQDVSYPPSSRDKFTFIDTDEGGASLFTDLKPGKYCVVPIGNYSATTKLTQEVYVSSDQVTTIMFGILKDE